MQIIWNWWQCHKTCIITITGRLATKYQWNQNKTLILLWFLQEKKEEKSLNSHPLGSRIGEFHCNVVRVSPKAWGIGRGEACIAVFFLLLFFLSRLMAAWPAVILFQSFYIKMFGQRYPCKKIKLHKWTLLSIFDFSVIIIHSRIMDWHRRLRSL